MTKQRCNPQKQNSKMCIRDSFKANGSYKVTAKTTKINIWASGVSLYVTENITLSEETYLAANCKLFILPNVTVTMPQSKNNGQINCLISVGKRCV